MSVKPTRKRKINIYKIVTASWLLLSYSIFFYAADEKIIFLAKEDGGFEMAGAIFFLLSAGLFFALFLKIRKNSHQLFITNFIFVLLSIFLLFACLEEVSWGQRIFNITTPQFLQKINRQKEINIHNLNIFHGRTEGGERKNFWARMLNLDRLFSVFWFAYCCVLPLINKLNRQIKTYFKKINFPMVPLFIGGFFILNYLLSKIIEFLINPTLNHYVVEIKESNFAFLYLILGIWFFKNRKYFIRNTDELIKHIDEKHDVY